MSEYLKLTPGSIDYTSPKISEPAFYWLVQEGYFAIHRAVRRANSLDAFSAHGFARDLRDFSSKGTDAHLLPMATRVFACHSTKWRDHPCSRFLPTAQLRQCRKVL
jgi:hypothetical protein